MRRPRHRLPPPPRLANLDRVNVVSQGIDLIENRRLGEVLERHRDRFLERVLTPSEQAYVNRMRDPLPHIAGRFAAKEAVFKVLGTGWRGGIAWTDVEITNNASGQPSVALSGECELIAQRKKIAKILISISHTHEYAAATAVGLSPAG